MLKTKHIAFDFKTKTAADGTFTGLLSPYGNVDEGGDVVEVGAYAKTIKERGNSVPLLWQHNSDMPIGEAVLDDRPESGLWVKGKLLLKLRKAAECYELIKSGVVSGLSVGYRTTRSMMRSDGARALKEIILYECSIVTFPMNELARISAVKKSNADTKHIQQLISELRKAYR